MVNPARSCRQRCLTHRPHRYGRQQSVPGRLRPGRLLLPRFAPSRIPVRDDPARIRNHARASGTRAVTAAARAVLSLPVRSHHARLSTVRGDGVLDR